MSRILVEWSLLLGEIELFDKDQMYILVVGYIPDNVAGGARSKDLYVRIWRENGSLVRGTWVNNIEDGTAIDNEKDALLRISPELLAKGMRQARRLEKLKAFA